jgi:anti-sigma factor RsiW
MNHPDIDEHQVIDRYVMGTLPPDEAERFEEHYLSCPQCLDQLAVAESLQRGFKRAAGQDAASIAVTRQLALFAWLSRLGRSRQAAVLAMALLVVVVAVLPGSLALRRLGEVDQELVETRETLKQERERAAAGSRTAAEVEKLRSELDASRRDLAQEQKAREQAAEQLAQARVPQANVPILYLDTVRSGGSSTEEPDHRLHRPPANGWAVLSLQLTPPFAQSYRATLRGAGGKELWRGTGLQPDEGGAVSLSLPGSLLEPGVYTVTVEATGAPASRFTFSVLPS